jgi:hypothetical protein
MLKYSDITQRFIEFRREQDEYWEHLRKAAYQLLKDLQVSLELPSESWTDETGKLVHYVDIGSIENGEFKRVHPMEFQGEDLRYSFAIRIALEESSRDVSKAFYFQRVTLFSNDEVIAVTLAGADHETVYNTSKDVVDGQFSNVVEAIKQNLMDVLTLKVSG